MIWLPIGMRNGRKKQKRKLDQELGEDRNGGKRIGWGAWNELFILLVVAILFFKPLSIPGLFRRRLKRIQGTLTGRIENNPKRGIETPTTVRPLEPWEDVTLSMVYLADQPILRQIPSLNPWRIRILELLGLPAGVTHRLAEN